MPATVVGVADAPRVCVALDRDVAPHPHASSQQETKQGSLAVADGEHDQPASLVPVFTKDGKGGWEIAESTLTRADELGCGLKTERGDRASVVMTPEAGRFSQMMLGVTRSVGDFYHQKYGVTWRPQVVVKDISEECGGPNGAAAACIILASDGVWDHWEFAEAMEELCDAGSALSPGAPPTTKKRVMAFFEETRAKGEEAFGDGADNLTGAPPPRTPPPCLRTLMMETASSRESRRRRRRLIRKHAPRALVQRVRVQASSPSCPTWALHRPTSCPPTRRHPPLLARARRRSPPRQPRAVLCPACQAPA